MKNVLSQAAASTLKVMVTASGIQYMEQRLKKRRCQFQRKAKKGSRKKRFTIK